MLRTLLGLVLLCASGPLSAQVNQPHYQPDIPTATRNKTTGDTVSWLMSDVRWGYDNGSRTYRDSFVYYYKPGMHNLDPVLKGWRAFEVAEYLYDNVKKTDICIARSFGNYNSMGQGIGGKWQFLNSNTKTWQDGGTDSFIYNGAGQVETKLTTTFDRQMNIWLAPTKIEYTYDSKGREADRTSYEWQFNSWRKIGTEINYYFGNSDTLVGAMAHPVKGANETLSDTKYTYTYANGWLVKRDIKSFASGIERDVYDYSKMPWITHWNYRTTDSTTFKVDTAKGVWHVNARGLIDSLYRVDHMGILPNIPGLGTHLVYNSYDQMIARREFYWSTSDKKLKCGQEQLWYYGVYAVGVDSKNDENTSVKLYPIPASQQLNLEVNCTTETSLMLAICNIDGRLIRTWNQLPLGRTYAEQIDIGFLAPGNYVLKVFTPQGGVVTKRFSVVR